MAYKIGMVSLGCPKNQVDAEMMLANLIADGFELTNDETQADAIIVNTCGFIEDAKREAIDNILEVAQLKKSGKLKALIVTGCLAQRYKKEMQADLPEIDAIVTLGQNENIARIVRDAINAKEQLLFSSSVSDMALSGDRILTTPQYMAYLKIAEGCDNCCTYCAIPKIRGRYRSRQLDDIIAEAENLVNSGVREITVVAQDTTRYGEDLYGKSMLPELLKRLNEIDKLKWIRVLYTYPERISDELLDTVANCDKVLKYFDIPIQHASDDILKRMNRKSDNKGLYELIDKIRTKIPDVTLRTTMIVGFPGETDEDFTTLAQFVKSAKFDRLGCFMYSQEEGTLAAEMDDQIEPDIKERRYEVIMTEQSVISETLAQSKIGETFEVLVEGYDRLNKCYYGRTKADAPDIDGKTFFTSEKKINDGEFVNVKITDTIEYDLVGELE
ncbi:MAG: 30S ribosomal protein S12 methylthiotransferase RimO [Acutalibacteraceae bacterium]|nr:30S ribosomal protein S12 methylthiotransferase RimO [Acutalibacteraceae bacterium]